VSTDDSNDAIETTLPPKRRERPEPLKVVVSSADRAQIIERAKACDLSVSAYLRTLGTSFEPKSTLDAQAIQHLLKALADLGRLGGLLKLWLSERPGVGASTVDVRRLLRQIEAQQVQLKTIIERLK
jgi:glycine cleavage system regulatory protein